MSSKKYYRKYKNEILKKQKEYKNNHKEHIRKMGIEYRKKNKSLIRKRKKEYRDKNKDNIQKHKHKYYLRSMDICKANGRRNYLRHKQRYIKRAKVWKKYNLLKVKLCNRNYRINHPNASVEWTVKRTIDVYNKFGNKCSKCGFSNVIALQIHHKNEKDKERKKDWRKLDYDLNKVELLCANCHMIFHYHNIKYGVKHD